MRMIFRFMGMMPVGEFELACLCGYYFGKKISWERREYCPRCDMAYEFIQQKNHWHIFIELAK